MARPCAMMGNATTSQNAERRRHVNRMNCKGGATRGNTTISRSIERRLHVKRMGGRGGAMTTRSNVITSLGKQNANGKWEVEVARQEAGARCEDGVLRGRGAPRG